MEDQDLQRAKGTIVLCAVSVFVCWETFKHLFLMSAPMFTRHLVSTGVEVLAAVGVAGLGLHLVGMVAQARSLSRAFNETVGAALGSNVVLQGTLRDLRTAVEGLTADADTNPQGVKHWTQLVEKRAHDLELALRALDSLSPESETGGPRTGEFQSRCLPLLQARPGSGSAPATRRVNWSPPPVAPIASSQPFLVEEY